MAAAVCLGTAHAAKPADHLLPESSYFDIAYDPLASTPTQREIQAIQSAFAFAFKYPNTRFRVLERGGENVKESVVGISTAIGGTPSIYVLQAQDFLTNYVLFHRSTDARSVKVDKCEIVITPELAVRIVDLTWAITLQTTYVKDDEEHVTNGSTEYHFHVEVPDYDVSKSIEGWTYPTSMGRKVGALIRLTAMMRDYCLSRDAKSLSAVQDQVDVLAKKLEAP